MMEKLLVIFGHACIIVGCYLVAWGIYLLPASEPTPLGILSKPLFWGLFSIFGGICANMHSSCQCIQAKQKHFCMGLDWRGHRNCADGKVRDCLSEVQ